MVKRLIVRLVIALLVAGAIIIWRWKDKVDEQPTEHKEPDIPTIDLPLPDPEEEE